MIKNMVASALAIAVMTAAGGAFAADKAPVDKVCQEKTKSTTSQEYLDCVKAKKTK